jgi:hypothetical protein
LAFCSKKRKRIQVFIQLLTNFELSHSCFLPAGLKLDTEAKEEANIGLGNVRLLVSKLFNRIIQTIDG